MSKKKRLLTDEEKFRIRMNQTHTERFYILMQLIKLNRKLQKATIIYPEKIS